LSEGQSREEKLDDAIRDMLDVVHGWTRPMTDTEKLEAIRHIGDTVIRETFSEEEEKG
jgi:hypothetical protein